MSHASGHASQIDATNSLAIWQRGIWFSEAPAFFNAGRPTISARSNTAVIDRRPALDKMDQAQLVKTAFEELREIGEQIVVDLRSRSDMARQLLELLQAGKLTAYGYLVPRNLSDEPVQIPRDLFQWRYIDWKNSAIHGAELEFVSIRILRPKWIESVVPQLARLPPPSPAAMQRRQPGRPSSAEAIIAAIRSLFAEGKLESGKTRKENVGLIRARVHEQNPTLFANDKGLAEETIAKYLAFEIGRLQTHKL